MLAEALRPGHEQRLLDERADGRIRTRCGWPPAPRSQAVGARLGDGSGRGREELALAVRAWRFGGAAALSVLEEEWHRTGGIARTRACRAGVGLGGGRTAFAALRVARTGGPWSARSAQLRLGRDGRWWPYRKERRPLGARRPGGPRSGDGAGFGRRRDRRLRPAGLGERATTPYARVNPYGPRARGAPHSSRPAHMPSRQATVITRRRRPEQERTSRGRWETRSGTRWAGRSGSPRAVSGVRWATGTGGSATAWAKDSCCRRSRPKASRPAILAPGDHQHHGEGGTDGDDHGQHDEYDVAAPAGGRSTGRIGGCRPPP